MFLPTSLSRAWSWRGALASALLLATAAGAASAQLEDTDEQARLRPTGLRFVVGVASPKHASSGLVLGAVAGMGSIVKPFLRTSLEVSRWKADLDRSKYGDTALGDLSDTRIAVDVRARLFRFRADDWGEDGLHTYLKTGLALHLVSADVPSDRSLEDALGSTQIGAEAAFGVAHREGPIEMNAEVRREFVSDVENWSFVFGIGTVWSRGD